MRYLFVLPTTALMGGVKVVLDLADQLAAAGESAHVFSFAGAPRWRQRHAALLPARDLAAVRFADYDFVLACNAFLLPVLLPLLRDSAARPVFFCQDYESFHHGDEPTFASYMQDRATFARLYRLPVPILATSRAIQRLISQRLGTASHHVPVAIDQRVFSPQPRPPRDGRRRVLFVGNYLMPYKGICDGIEALRRLAPELPVTMVLVTQEERGRERFDGLPFPVEIHLRPTEPHLPAIYAGCDLYCCASWYEGFGLPALEAFACGTPVVSTRTYGVSDYGRDGENLLLAQPNDPTDLAAQIGRVLRDPALAEQLRQGGLRTVRGRYDWAETVQAFRAAMAEIDRTYHGPGPVDADALGALLADLEAEGSITPIEVFREFEQLARRLDELCAAIVADSEPAPQGALAALRDGFRRHLGNQRAEYYAAFKAKFDLCQLLLGLADSDAFADYVGVVARRGATRALQPSPALSEIRYPLP
jgi:glycosyltransferase involved in cell wall biosynthesis